MRFALSALCAMLLLAGNTGCSSCCTPILHDDCKGEDGGSRFRFRGFRCPDTCGQCCDGYGEPSVSHQQPWQDVESAVTSTPTRRSLKRGRSQTQAPRQIAQASQDYDEGPPAN